MRQCVAITRVHTGRTSVESAFSNQGITLAIVLVAIPLACWAWVIAMARDMYGPMTGASSWMMTVTWDTPRLLLLWAMWAAMMAAMMLPSAAPLLLLYARAMRNRAEPDARSAPTAEGRPPSREAERPALKIYAMAAGYVLVWMAFSAGATALQRLLAESQWLTMMMEPASPIAAAVLLFIAGVYQFTPLKAACLSWCYSPIQFISRRWHEGVGGAFRMGASHGLYCLGCCWALMLLLFAGGVMNLAVILALTVWVAIEKLAPFGKQSARVAGALLIGLGIWMLRR